MCDQSLMFSSLTIWFWFCFCLIAASLYIWLWRSFFFFFCLFFASCKTPRRYINQFHGHKWVKVIPIAIWSRFFRDAKMPKQMNKKVLCSNTKPYWKIKCAHGTKKKYQRKTNGKKVFCRWLWRRYSLFLNSTHSLSPNVERIDE